MSTNDQNPTTPTETDHGFELKTRRRWPWIAGGAAAVVGIVAAVGIPARDCSTVGRVFVRADDHSSRRRTIAGWEGTHNVTPRNFVRVPGET